MGFFKFGRDVKRAAQEIQGSGAKEANQKKIDELNRVAEENKVKVETQDGANENPNREYRGEAINVDVDAIQAQMDAQRESIEQARAIAEAKKAVESVPLDSADVQEAPWGDAQRMEAIQADTGEDAVA